MIRIVPLTSVLQLILLVTTANAQDENLREAFNRGVSAAQSVPGFPVAKNDNAHLVTVTYTGDLTFTFISRASSGADCAMNIISIAVEPGRDGFERSLWDEGCDGLIDHKSDTLASEKSKAEFSESEYRALTKLLSAAADTFEAVQFVNTLTAEDAPARARANPYLMNERVTEAIKAASQTSLSVQGSKSSERRFGVVINAAQGEVGQTIDFYYDTVFGRNAGCSVTHFGEAVETYSAVTRPCNDQFEAYAYNGGQFIRDGEVANAIALSALDSLLRFSWVANKYFAAAR